MASESKDRASASFAVGGPLAQRIRALGADMAGAERTSDRVEADMGAMIRRFGLDLEQLRKASPLEALAAETCCASCDSVGRCHGYLAGAPDRPEEFCPNAATFAELGRKTDEPAR
jgi:hypothetical protein